jgi:hypothetical protein
MSFASLAPIVQATRNARPDGSRYRFRRLHIPARCRLDSVSGYANGALIQASGSVFLQKRSWMTRSDLAIFALPEVVITNSSFPVDEVLRRPVFVVERLPNPVVAVDGDRVGDLQIAQAFSTFTRSFSNENSGVCTPITTRPASLYFAAQLFM